MYLCVCILSHRYIWHTNMYAVTLVQKYILFAPGDPYWEVLQVASPSHLPTMPCTPSVLCFARPYRSQLPATLRVKSIFHKQGQRAWAGREYKQLPRGTRQLGEHSKETLRAARWGWGGPCSQRSRGSKSEPFSVESIDCTDQEPPALQKPHTQGDKGAIQGLRQGRMPRGSGWR